MLLKFYANTVFATKGHVGRHGGRGHGGGVDVYGFIRLLVIGH